MKNTLSAISIAALLCMAACTSTTKSGVDQAKLNISGQQAPENGATDSGNNKEATAAEILAKKEVPVLCYHQIRDWKASDSKRAHDDIMPPAKFAEHIKMLADSGYNSISPDQLYN